jgi:glycogen synthase
MRVAVPAWEIGHVHSGLGVKIGGLGMVVEELCPELVKAAARQSIDLEVDILSPCFAHYDKRRLTKLDLRLPVVLGGHAFEFEVYEHVFPDGQRGIYFWDEGQLHWTNAATIYPSDPQMAANYYATIGQAMAGYIKQGNYDTVHLHDYHVGLIPFYVGDDYLRKVPIHFTIHNATYQGVVPPPYPGGQAGVLDRLNLPGRQLYHHYFEHFNEVNLMRGCVLKVHEMGGKITTVSGDLEATWGYAAELRESIETVRAKAQAQEGSPPGQVFVPNGGLDLFEKLPIVGITNGISQRNRPENLPELKAEVLQALQEERGLLNPIFTNPTTQRDMLAHDHNYDVDSLHVKAELRRLLYLEVFGREPYGYPHPILLTVVNRLVEQKNLGLVADIVERVMAYDHKTVFIIVAAAPDGDMAGKADEERFFQLANSYPDRVYFNNSFSGPLSRLVLAGGDFTLIPSRFEPCGLVDYEASLLGTVVIGHAVGGLTKVRDCAYLYDWLDISDRAGEANAFFQQIKTAIDDYRQRPEHYVNLVRRAMAIDAGWEKPAAKYVGMYRYGLIRNKWYRERQAIIDQFTRSLGPDREQFAKFFVPGQADGADSLDQQLKATLMNVQESTR